MVRAGHVSKGPGVTRAFGFQDAEIEPPPCKAKADRRYNSRRRANPDSDDAFYSSPFWRGLRLDHLAIEPLCRYCLAAGRVTPATVVHHIEPREMDGADAHHNLASSCVPCHNRVELRGVTARGRGASSRTTSGRRST